MDKLAAWKDQLAQGMAHESDPSPILKQRQAALEALPDLPWPDITEVEAYRDWPLFTGEGGRPSSDASPPLSSHQRIIDLGACQLAMDLGGPGAQEAVQLESLFDLSDSGETLLATYYGQASSGIEDRVQAYHYAFMNLGLLLYVPPHLEGKLDIQLTLYPGPGFQGPFNYHLLAIIGDHSQVSLTQKTVIHGQAQLSGVIMEEIILGPGAQLEANMIDQSPANSHQFIIRRSRLGQDAALTWTTLGLNQGHVVVDFDSDLSQPGAVSHSQMAVFSQGQQVFGCRNKVSNKGPHTQGHIRQKGIIMDQSQLSLTGIGHIYPDAYGSDAQQESRILMFGRGCRGDANPILLIHENDVTAGHAASAGQVDADHMYYLMSRGLDEAAARKLVIRGFVGDIISSLSSRSLQREILAMIDERLTAYDA